MNLHHQIKSYRTSLNLTQDGLADKIFVSRQTISNWENEKSYPDIHSLILLSEVFDVSLDQLVKGDLEIMKEVVHSVEIEKFKKLSNVFSFLLILFVISAIPLIYFLRIYGSIISAVLFIVTMYFALKVEKLKKKYNIQTYKEILAFINGEKLDAIVEKREKETRKYQKILIVLGFMLITTMVSVIFYVIFKLLGL